ncbi:MAG: ribonuclease R, partial [Verrucomicrobiales bacterium]
QKGTGSVTRILERTRKHLVGTFQDRGDRLVVAPDDPRLPAEIYVPPPRDVGRTANDGDKVVVELMEWTSRESYPEGVIIEVLGPPDAEGVDMLSVLRQYDLPLHFPKPVLDQAEKIGNQVREEEIAGRVDCRDHMVVTIDPDDAKDFDDAICIQKTENGDWRLWVHVADVSHYVLPGSPLDVEAEKRGNSTYLVDRVIPMLPEALSNELCSLKPNVDRLTSCVEFVLSNDGRVIESKYYSAVIHSKRRYSYQEVFGILQRKPNDRMEQMLHEANDIAQKIRRRRFAAGSLDLDFPERKIRLNEKGEIIRIEKVINDISHQLIEEFMLIANEAVASVLMGRSPIGMYRIHEPPDPLRLQEFCEEVSSHHIPCGDLTKRSEVQKLLARLDEFPMGAALKINFLKSLMRAKYSADPVGHYGLAKEKYTHFTSPIRRYADLIVHRLLFKKVKMSPQTLQNTADHISETERNSADAERDSKDVKLYAFLKKQLASGAPTIYPAMVIDIRAFGFFVEVPDLAMSGFVHLSTMDDDYYIFDNERQNLVGRRTRNVIAMGHQVQVQVHKVDTYKKQVDFRVAQGSAIGREPAGGRKGAKPGRLPPLKPKYFNQGTEDQRSRKGGPKRKTFGRSSGPASRRRDNTEPPVGSGGKPARSRRGGQSRNATTPGRETFSTSYSKGPVKQGGASSGGGGRRRRR